MTNFRTSQKYFLLYSSRKPADWEIVYTVNNYYPKIKAAAISKATAKTMLKHKLQITATSSAPHWESDWPEPAWTGRPAATGYTWPAP